MYRYLLLDFDNTLMDFNETERIALGKTFETLFQKELTAEDTALYHRINDSYWKETKVIKGLETVVEYPEAEEACRQLSKRYKLYVITNGTTYIQKARYAGTGFQKHMDGIVISDEVGVDKPDPRFFDAVVKLTGDSDARHYLVVGDSLSSDIRFGKNIGADTCRIGEPTEEADFCLSGIAQLSDYLAQKAE